MCGGGGILPQLLEGYWEPEQLARYVGKSRQSVVDAINGAGKRHKFPRRLHAQKFGQYLLIPDPEAQAFVQWVRSGELLPETRYESKRLWTLEEVAIRAGMSVRSINRLVGTAGSERPLIGTKLQGRIWLIATPEVESFVEVYRQPHIAL